MANNTSKTPKQEGRDAITQHIKGKLQAIGPPDQKKIEAISQEKDKTKKDAEIAKMNDATNEKMAEAIASAFLKFLENVEVTIPEITTTDLANLTVSSTGGTISGKINPPKGAITWKTTTST